MRKSIQEITELFGVSKPIIGMVHLKPLPGSPIYTGKGLKEAIKSGLEDARTLLEGGVDGIEIENYGDLSYFPNVAPSETVASLSIVAHEIRKAFPEAIIGICVLSDPIASLSIAHCVQAQFVRATFFTEASVDVSGLVLRKPHEILRFRRFLDPSIKIFADVHIKHSAPLAHRPIEESAYDAAYFLADAVIISGKHTGFETDIEDLKKAKGVLSNFPVFIGSGLNPKNAWNLLSVADGAIVGTSLKVGGETESPVDPKRVKELMEVVKAIRNKK